MGIIQQIYAEFINQVPNAELLLLFQLVAVGMSVMSTLGISIGAIFDAKAEVIEMEKLMVERRRNEEARGQKLLELETTR